MTHLRRRTLLAAVVLLLGVAAAQPPAPYVNASELLPLPEFIPGAGALYIDPANAPIGPWLAYGQDGTLVEVLFMVPVAAMQESQSWENLARGTLAEFGIDAIDHVDVTFNGGHPGMAEAHYHFRLVLIDDAAQQEALAP